MAPTVSTASPGPNTATAACTGDAIPCEPWAPPSVRFVQPSVRFAALSGAEHPAVVARLALRADIERSLRAGSRQHVIRDALAAFGVVAFQTPRLWSLLTEYDTDLCGALRDGAGAAFAELCVADPWTAFAHWYCAADLRTPRLGVRGAASPLDRAPRRRRCGARLCSIRV